MLSAFRRWVNGERGDVEKSELVVRIEALERGFKGIRDEWEEAYDRLHRVLGRINARARASQNEKVEEPPEEQPEEKVANLGRFKRKMRGF